MNAPDESQRTNHKERNGGDLGALSIKGRYRMAFVRGPAIQAVGRARRYPKGLRALRVRIQLGVKFSNLRRSNRLGTVSSQAQKSAPW